MTIYLKRFSAVPNVGDVLSARIVAGISRRDLSTIGETASARPNLIAAGSIAHWSDANSVLWGCGLVNDWIQPSAHPARVLAVRGSLTRAQLDRLRRSRVETCSATPASSCRSSSRHRAVGTRWESFRTTSIETIPSCETAAARAFPSSTFSGDWSAMSSRSPRAIASSRHRCTESSSRTRTASRRRGCVSPMTFTATASSSSTTIRRSASKAPTSKECVPTFTPSSTWLTGVGSPRICRTWFNFAQLSSRRSRGLTFLPKESSPDESACDHVRSQRGRPHPQSHQRLDRRWIGRRSDRP